MRTMRTAIALAAGFVAMASAVKHHDDVGMGASGGTKLDLTLLNGTTCIDGTPSGYYYAPPKSRDGVWVIYLQGGGLCETYYQCKQRAKTALGSSRSWKPTKSNDWPLMLDDPTRNPDFADAHHVFVSYCSGDTFRGTKKAPGPYGLSFTGHTNLLAVFNDLEAKYGFLSRSTHVIMGGDSAGGLGAFVNADVLAGMFTSEPVYKIAPSAGLFFPVGVDQAELPPANFSCFKEGRNCGIADITPMLAEFWGSYRNEACAADHAPEDAVVCESVGVLMKYIETPMYVLEHQYDINQIFSQQGAPQPPTKDPRGVDYVKMYGAAMRKTTGQVTRGIDGVFSPSCARHEVEGFTKINGMTWPPLVSDWFWGHGKYTASYKMTEECDASAGGLPCNKQGSCQI